MKAQGSTEYLIILAVVLVIAVVVVSLLSGGTSFSESSTSNLYQSYWVSSSPFAITSSGQALSSSSGAANNTTISIENHAPRELVMTGITLTLPSTGASVSNSTQLVFSPGEAKQVSIVLGSSGGSCANRAGKYISYNVNISYNDGSYSRVQIGSRPLMVACQG